MIFSSAKQAGLDPEGEVNFLFGVEQGDLADLLQVVLDGVGGGAGRHDLLDRGVVVVGIGVDESGAGGCGGALPASSPSSASSAAIGRYVVEILFDIHIDVVIRR